ncbi:MAG: glycoside hydrolase family 99-like domain-containing protein [Candidatus Omnitrophica bacterium]|nr:glycoside hydrolase family 99-like domain-containing protein [Candidatus Omnitrophota bacterium]
MAYKNYRGEVAAIYFPSWHPDAHYQSWYGKGFTEWELVKTAKPLFENHHQPKVPEWGYFDESNLFKISKPIFQNG